MPETMWAMRLKSLDGPDGLELVSVPAPQAGPNNILIDVHAAGVSFADLLMTRGRYQVRPEPPFIPGTEIAGIVRSAPADSGLQPGDRVASSGLGAWAEVATAPATMTYVIPDAMSFEQATALLNYQTAVFGLLDRGRLQPGETVLVQGAAGGTGTTAIEVARGEGASVIAIARGEEKLRACAELGANHCIDAESDWLSEVKSITGGRGVDLVYDPVGGSRFLDSMRALAPLGRLVIIGFTSGTIPEVKVNRLLLRNTSLVGAAWGEYIRLDPTTPRRIAKEITRLYDAGALKPRIGAIYPLADTPLALREIDERRAIGKIAIKIRS